MPLFQMSKGAVDNLLKYNQSTTNLNCFLEYLEEEYVSSQSVAKMFLLSFK